MHKRAAITTLGCKLNQFEGEQIRQELERHGYEIVPFGEQADLYVVNSCTVTGKSDRDARRLARQAKHRNPQAVVVVAGCYAEVSPDALRAIPEVDLVLGNAEKLRLAGLLKPEAGPPPGGEHGCAGPVVHRFAGHTRAFVKVQEGCNAHCAYCIVPQARGPSRSVPPVHVAEQVERFVGAGHAEVVLIGTHLGQYGADRPQDGLDLAGLVRWLVEVPGLRRLRLSSVEPREVSGSLLELVAHHPRVCRHLHIPLQSGSDSVLARMRRPYDTAFYGELARRIHSLDPQIALGADAMVGFPQETQAESEAGYAFIAALPLSYLHVFRYSPRPGTAAAAMSGQVRPDLKKERSRRLTELSHRQRSAFAERLLGEQLEVVVEGEREPTSGRLTALTDNYLRALVPGEDALIGRVLRVRLTAATESGILAEPQLG